MESLYGQIKSLEERVYANRAVYESDEDTEGLILPEEELRGIYTNTHSTVSGIDVYGDQLFYAEPLAAELPVSTPNIYALNINDYRPLQVRTDITPQVLSEGDSIPLKTLVLGATQILSIKNLPAHLSIE